MSETPLVDVRITTATGPSRIVVGAGLSERLGALVAERWPRASATWLVSHEAIARHYDRAIHGSLAAAGLRVHAHAVPEGESSKSFAQVTALYDWLLEGGVERGDVMVALGGGVIGDLAGFVAATCLRGLPLVQVPTTLLAMVDSSVGGKTGVNHATGKNLIGAFYQPPLVVVDPALLATLPPRELASGWAEVIKYGMIERSIPGSENASPRLLAWLEDEGEALRRLEPEPTARVIHHCVDLKARVVEVDPTEQGVRIILNYGHTIGHGLEAAAGYGALLHGEAVAVGMRAAANIAVATGRCAPDLLERQQRLIRAFHLPETAAGLSRDEVWAFMRRDKKVEAGALRWVLPTGPGSVEIARGVDEATVERALTLVMADPAPAAHR